METPERDRSLVHDFESEWRKRPVNVMKIFKSLVNQLTVGADLTRITMPSEICHPFSVLEVIAYRELSYFSTLFTLNSYPENPLERFLCVVRWLISCLPQEQMEKKPFNPTIGEEHICWIEHAKDDWTELIAEQVSHHPPLSAFFLRNEKQNITLQSSLDFSVSFGGANHVVIISGSLGGSVIIKSAFEDYHMNKLTPNLIIQRIIFGVKYYMWDGDLVLECPKHEYKLNISFSETNETTNKIKGHISKNGITVYKIGGACGKVVHYWKPEEKKKKKELYNFSTSPKAKDDTIVYPPPKSRVSMNSLQVWKAVADAIIQDDMIAADNAKRKVEDEQRLREKTRELEGASYKALYFDQMISEKIVWVPKEDIKLNQEYIEGLKVVAASQREKEWEEESQQQSQTINQCELKPKTPEVHKTKNNSTDSLRNANKDNPTDEKERKLRSPEKKKGSKGTPIKNGEYSKVEQPKDESTQNHTTRVEGSGQPTGDQNENCKLS